ncbi:hypothetical protein EYR41_006076 [Orbilia oligospora]|uniref:C2H2-type domain-containing protein n=1 Tax=Orbilia oligospora TaxID=2813651 RepID=A0A8H2E285_ORBOL|nr:hypothetical protein EYR41_006076 [Orbilia oligospora]
MSSTPLSPSPSLMSSLASQSNLFPLGPISKGLTCPETTSNNPNLELRSYTIDGPGSDFGFNSDFDMSFSSNADSDSCSDLYSNSDSDSDSDSDSVSTSASASNSKANTDLNSDLNSKANADADSNSMIEWDFELDDLAICDAISDEEDGVVVKAVHAPTTREGMDNIWKKWTQFSCGRREKDPIRHLEKVDQRELKIFLNWHLRTGRTKKVKSICSTYYKWKQVYKYQIGRNYNPYVDDTLSYIRKVLKKKFNLEESTKDKPTANVDDLRVVLHHLWHFSNQHFAIERCRIQLAAVVLLICATSCRPGSLVEIREMEKDDDAALESKKKPKAGDSLKYKDIELYLVRHPNQDLKGEVCLVMLLRNRLSKRSRNLKEPTIFVLFEISEPFGFDIISYILALAFDDNAFESVHIKEPADLYRFTIPDHMATLPFHWKKEILETPIFRAHENTNEGPVISSSKGLSENVISKQGSNLGLECGFRNPMNMYVFRRGAGKAMDATVFKEGSRIISDAARCKAMGHSDPKVFDQYYTSQTAEDIQSAYLGRPSDDGLLQLMSNMSFRRDPTAKSKVDDSIRLNCEADEKYKALSLRADALRKAIKSKTRTIKAAKEQHPILYQEYQKVTRQRASRGETLRKQAFESAWTEYFSSNGTSEIDKQAHGIKVPSYEEILPANQCEERTIVAELLFPKSTPHLKQTSEMQKDPPYIEVQDCVEDKTGSLRKAQRERILVIERMITLCRLRTGIKKGQPKKKTECFGTQGKIMGSYLPQFGYESGYSQAEGIRSVTEVDVLGLEMDIHRSPVFQPTAPVLPDPLQCPACFFDSNSSPAKRYRQFSNKSNLQRHFSQQHLALYKEVDMYFCPYPACNRHSESQELGFKSHLAIHHSFEAGNAGRPTPMNEVYNAHTTFPQWSEAMVWDQS